MPPVVTGVDLPPPRGRGRRGRRGRRGHFFSFLFFLTCGFVSRTWLLDLCYRASSLEWAVVRVRRDNGAVQDVKL